MAWSVAGASVILAALNWRQVAGWLTGHSAHPSTRPRGFGFATLYALIAVPLCLTLVDGQPLPRFNDIFLIGIALTVFFFSWQAAAYLLGVSVVASAWILQPYGSLRVEGFVAWYRLTSFTLVAILVMILLTRLKARQAAGEGRQRISAPASGG